MDNSRLVLLNGEAYIDVATLDEQRRIPLLDCRRPKLTTVNSQGRSGRAKSRKIHPVVLSRMIKEGR